MIGTKIIVSQHATKEQVNWPIKKRSRRLHKKMTKRLGQQITIVPCAFQTPMGMVVHPLIFEKLRKAGA